MKTRSTIYYEEDVREFIRTMAAFDDAKNHTIVNEAVKIYALMRSPTAFETVFGDQAEDIRNTILRLSRETAAVPVPDASWKRS